MEDAKGPLAVTRIGRWTWWLSDRLITSGALSGYAVRAIGLL